MQTPHVTIQAIACSVICNMSEHEDVRVTLTAADAAPTLIQLLGSHVDDIQSRAAVVLADLAAITENQETIGYIIKSSQHQLIRISVFQFDLDYTSLTFSATQRHPSADRSTGL